MEDNVLLSKEQIKNPKPIHRLQNLQYLESVNIIVEEVIPRSLATLDLRCLTLVTLTRLLNYLRTQAKETMINILLFSLETLTFKKCNKTP